VVESFASQRIVVRVDAAAPSLLVLAESAVPGWRAFVDGAETPVLRADEALRACAVPAGAHRVEFVYAAPGLRSGATVSALCLALFLALALAARRPAARSCQPGVLPRQA
jgi:uncharacterized membrane protein YfhO